MYLCQSLPCHDLHQKDEEVLIDLLLVPLPSLDQNYRPLLFPTDLLEVEKKDESCHCLQASLDHPGSTVEAVCEVEPRAAQ